MTRSRQGKFAQSVVIPTPTWPLVSRFRSSSLLADRLGEDLVGALDPGERRRPSAPVDGEGVDPVDELLDRTEAAPPDSLATQDAEPRLDLVHPRGGGRSEVEA